LDIDELLILKQEYGISMQAWARRAFDLQIITTHYYRNFCRLFSIKGWRKLEPGDQIEEERPLRFLLLIRQAVAEGIITPTRAAELTNEFKSKTIQLAEDYFINLDSMSIAEEYTKNNNLTELTNESPEDFFDYGD
jgi:Zn-dependent peptidase ImmA (M78 family)